ncbi:MAG: response regulator [Acidobacteriia bacterium]|nr:response regulator [Terriglobia bacterium]
MPMRSLVVDDARVTQLILEKILTAYGDCQVARNGYEAMLAFGQALGEGRPYDLICLDMGLPDFGGLEVLMKIRATEEEHGIAQDQSARVIAITASRDIATVKAVTQMGDGYILKPINRQRLIRDIVNLGLIAPPKEETETVEAFSKLCKSDVVPVHTLAELMGLMASSIARQSAARFPSHNAPDGNHA